MRFGESADFFVHGPLKFCSAFGSLLSSPSPHCGPIRPEGIFPALAGSFPLRAFRRGDPACERRSQPLIDHVINHAFASLRSRSGTFETLGTESHFTPFWPIHGQFLIPGIAKPFM
jgi:hypothetical protein